MEGGETAANTLLAVDQKFPQLLIAVRGAAEARSSKTFFQTEFPYYKTVHGDTPLVLLKIDPTQYGPTIVSFDIGKPDGSKFLSEAFFDFRIVPNRDPAMPEREYGYSDMRQEVSQGKFVTRVGHTGKEALYVTDALRRQGIGKALLSMSRVVLDGCTVPSLVLGEALSLNPDEKLGKFYAQTGGKQYRVTHTQTGMYGGDRDADYKANRVIFPSQQSADFPYQLP